jgi:hypothetical protein
LFRHLLPQIGGANIEIRRRGFGLSFAARCQIGLSMITTTTPTTSRSRATSR